MDVGIQVSGTRFHWQTTKSKAGRQRNAPFLRQPGFLNGMGETRGFPATPHGVFGFSGDLSMALSLGQPPNLSGYRRSAISFQPGPLAVNDPQGTQIQELARNRTRPKRSGKTITPSLVSS
jgi:hypothetical protein